MKKYYFIIFIILLFWPLATKGAILYLEPSTGQYYQNDVFLVEIRLDTQGEYINVVNIELKYPQDILEAKDFSKGNSILTLWVKEPAFSNGVILFIGGVPGGYWGAGGLLAKIAFRTHGTDTAKIEFLDSSKVLLNDGKGTKARLTTKGAVFDILAEKLEVPKDEWKEEIEGDNILPELFKVEINQDTAIFEGKYFITFSTTDKQTGIDYYEVKEGRRDWKRAISPYVLENQKLTSDIWVKAIDKAGNYWMETLEAQNKPGINYLVYVSLGLILVLVVVILWIIFRRKAKT